MMGKDRHLFLEIAHAKQIRAAVPLEPGSPVPGCACPECTGLPARQPSRGGSSRGSAIPDDQFQQVRSIPLSRVCTRLGLGGGIRRGKELAFTCPLHDDSNPSLRVNPEKNLCYCDVCARGGDGIWLVSEVLKKSFGQAVLFILGPF